MDLFIKQVTLSNMKLAYTIASSMSDALSRIEAYLKLNDKSVEDVVIYHSMIMTNKSKVVFLYTEAIESIDDFDKSQIQILEVKESDYLAIRVSKDFYKNQLFKNEEVQANFNSEIKEYCHLHNLVQYLNGFSYLAQSIDDKEELYFPVKNKTT
jgi:hypothetical protein